jgi:hypothetical protein
MNIQKLKEILNAKVVNEGEAQELKGGYCGDFLSHVMGKAQEGAVWFTIMSNINVAAVAHLTGVGAVVICDNVKAEPLLVAKCTREGISLLETELDVYNAAVAYSRFNI